MTSHGNGPALQKPPGRNRLPHPAKKQRGMLDRTLSTSLSAPTRPRAFAVRNIRGSNRAPRAQSPVWIPTPHEENASQLPETVPALDQFADLPITSKPFTGRYFGAKSRAMLSLREKTTFRYSLSISTSRERICWRSPLSIAVASLSQS